MLFEPFWDNTKTQRENFAQLGITLNVNEDLLPRYQTPNVQKTNLLAPGTKLTRTVFCLLTPF